jgi:hypothetical protein
MPMRVVLTLATLATLLSGTPSAKQPARLRIDRSAEFPRLIVTKTGQATHMFHSLVPLEGTSLVLGKVGARETLLDLSSGKQHMIRTIDEGGRSVVVVRLGRHEKAFDRESGVPLTGPGVDALARRARPSVSWPMEWPAARTP